MHIYPSMKFKLFVPKWKFVRTHLDIGNEEMLIFGNLKADIFVLENYLYDINFPTDLYQKAISVKLVVLIHDIKTIIIYYISMNFRQFI